MKIKICSFLAWWAKESNSKQKTRYRLHLSTSDIQHQQLHDGSTCQQRPFTQGLGHPNMTSTVVGVPLKAHSKGACVDSILYANTVPNVDRGKKILNFCQCHMGLTLRINEVQILDSTRASSHRYIELYSDEGQSSLSGYSLIIIAENWLEVRTSLNVWFYIFWKASHCIPF